VPEFGGLEVSLRRGCADRHFHCLGRAGPLGRSTCETVGDATAHFRLPLLCPDVDGRNIGETHPRSNTLSTAATILPSMVPLIVLAAMRRAEARIHRQLSVAGAFTAESAIQLSLSRRIDRRRLHGLVSGGAVRPAADGRHFLDATGWDEYQHDRRRRSLFAVSVVVAIVGIGVAAFFVLQ